MTFLWKNYIKFLQLAKMYCRSDILSWFGRKWSEIKFILWFFVPIPDLLFTKHFCFINPPHPNWVILEPSHSAASVSTVNTLLQGHFSSGPKRRKWASICCCCCCPQNLQFSPHAALFCLVPSILAPFAKNILISPYDCHTNYILHQLGAFNGLHPVKRRAAFSHSRECQRRVQRGRWWRYKKARKEHIKQRKEADELLNEGNQYKGGQ